jgi:hypothetical protein
MPSLARGALGAGRSRCDAAGARGAALRRYVRAGAWRRVRRAGGLGCVPGRCACECAPGRDRMQCEHPWCPRTVMPPALPKKEESPRRGRPASQRCKRGARRGRGTGETRQKVEKRREPRRPANHGSCFVHTCTGRVSQKERGEQKGVQAAMGGRIKGSGQEGRERRRPRRAGCSCAAARAEPAPQSLSLLSAFFFFSFFSWAQQGGGQEHGRRARGLNVVPGHARGLCIAQKLGHKPQGRSSGARPRHA